MYRCEGCNNLVTWEELRRADNDHKTKLDLCEDCASKLSWAIDGALDVLVDMIEAQFELV